MPGLIPWWSLLQQPPDLSGTTALQNQALRLKVQQAQQQQQGYNALAQLFRDPNNLQNGMLKPEAIQQLGGVYPPAALDMMEAQAKIGQQRQLSAMRGAEFQQKMAQNAVNDLVPLVSEYDTDRQSLGDEAALQKFRKGVNDKIEAMRSAGTYPPQFVDGLSRSPPTPDSLRAMALGSKALQTPAQQRAETREQAKLVLAGRKEGREESKAAVAGIEPKYVGTMDDGKGGKTEVRYHYEVQSGKDDKGNTVDKTVPIDDQGKPVDLSKLTGVRKMAGSQAAAPYTISDEDAEMLARQRMAGDVSALQGLGWGNQGSINRGKVIDAMRRLGATGENIAAARAEFSATTSAAQTAGRRAAQIGMAINELKAFIPEAKRVSETINRTQFPTLNSVLLSFEAGTGDENVRRLAVVTNEVINAYAGVATRGGMPTDAARQQGHDILANAFTKGQYASALDQMMTMAETARSAPEATVKEMTDRLRNLYSPNEGKTKGSSSAAPPLNAPAQPAALSPDTIEPGPKVGGAANSPMEVRKGHEQEDWSKIPSGNRYIWNGKVGVKP